MEAGSRVQHQSVATRNVVELKRNDRPTHRQIKPARIDPWLSCGSENTFNTDRKAGRIMPAARQKNRLLSRHRMDKIPSVSGDTKLPLFDDETFIIVVALSGQQSEPMAVSWNSAAVRISSGVRGMYWTQPGTSTSVA